MSDALLPHHLRPVAPLAPRALLPGDPGRALALATAVLGDDRRMFNHHRGLWGYTGTAADGDLLTIQSTGIGGPSAAIVLEELGRLGLRAAVRVGTCRALGDTLALGDAVAVMEVLGADGASRALGAAERHAPDRALAARLAATAGHAGLVVSADLFYDNEGDGAADRWRAAGVVARDLQTAALAAVAARHGVRFGAILTVVADGAGRRLDDEAIAAAGEVAGRAAAAALVAPARLGG